MSKVYFLKIKKQSPKVLYKAGKEISGKVLDFFSPKDKLAVKVHFGEEGNKTYLGPDFTKAICENLDKKVKSLALVDCTVLYKGERSFASTHKKLALRHGFDFAPVSILDGERGNLEVEIKIKGKHFKEAKIGKGIERFNSILAISHFKGHGATGFGGALKNIGMGLGSKAGKMAMHQAFKIAMNESVCIGCGACKRKCPGGAISIKDGKAKIDYKKCISCGLCISVCPCGAVEIPWQAGDGNELQERIVEYAAAVLKGRKAFFINVLTSITQNCDCMGMIQKPIMPDIGVLFSDDIVAIEKASLDLAGDRSFRAHGIDPNVQIDYAQKLGLGRKKFTLVKLN
jgi:hypothetical protein